MLWNMCWQFAKEHPWLTAANLGFMAFVPINEILLPHLYGTLVNAFQAKKPFESAMFWCATVVTVVHLGYWVRDKVAESYFPAFENFMRANLVEMMLSKFNTCLTPLTTGDIVAQLSKFPDIMTRWFEWLNDFIIPYIIVFVVAAGYFFTIDPALSLYFVVLLLVIAAVFVYAPRVCKHHAIAKDSEFASYHEKVEEILQNLATVYSMNTVPVELGLLSQSGNNYETSFKSASHCVQNMKLFLIPCVTIFFVAFVYRCNALIKDKRMTVGLFVSIFMIMTYILGSIYWLIEIIKQAVFDLGSIHNIHDMIRPADRDKVLHPPAVRPPTKDPATGAPVAIGLHNVTFSFKKGDKPLLNNVSINFERGQSTVLLGNIGTGKSTVLKLLMRFYIPDSGDLYIASDDARVGDKWYSEMTVTGIRERIGYVPQEPVLFNNTILYNIKYGNTHDIPDEAVAKLLRDIGLESTFADGIHTNVGKNGSKLSGGQRQLIWCLRVLLQDPDIIVLDEPTASMDKDTKDLLLHLLDTMMNNKTVIMVTHDQYLVERATRKVYL